MNLKTNSIKILLWLPVSKKKYRPGLAWDPFYQHSRFFGSYSFNLRDLNNLSFHSKFESRPKADPGPVHLACAPLFENIFLFFMASSEAQMPSSHRTPLKFLPNRRCQTVDASAETMAYEYLLSLLNNFNSNWEVNKKWNNK